MTEAGILISEIILLHHAVFQHVLDFKFGKIFICRISFLKIFYVGGIRLGNFAKMASCCLTYYIPILLTSYLSLF